VPHTMRPRCRESYLESFATIRASRLARFYPRRGGVGVRMDPRAGLGFGLEKARTFF